MLGNLEGVVIKILGGMLALFGIIMIIGVLAGISNGETGSSVAADVALTGLLGVAPVLGGVYLFRYANQRTKKRKEEETEKLILELASRHGGKISSLDLTSHSDLSLEEAKAFLDNLQTKGIAALRVTENGNILYEFTGATMSQSERDSSQGV